MKYNNLMKASQDIERTSSGLPTDIPTDQQVQSNIMGGGKGKKDVNAKLTT
jgi:hypothetical protein